MAAKNVQPTPEQIQTSQPEEMIVPAGAPVDMVSYAQQQQIAGARRKRKNIIIGVIVSVVILAVLVAIFFLVRNANTSGNSTYLTSQVQNGTIERTISGSGQLAAGSTSAVTAQVSGTVTGLTVKLGDTVTKGQVLFTVDDNGTLAAAVTTASNSLESARLSLTSAQDSLASAKAASVTTAQELMDQAAAGNTNSSSSTGGASSSGRSGASGASTPSSTSSSTTLTWAQAQAKAAQANAQRLAQIASAQAQVKQAQAQVSSAQSDYDTAVANQGKTTVTAPSSGVITTLNVKNGDSVTGSSSSSSNNNASSNNDVSAYSGLGGNNNNNNSSSNSNSSSSSAAVEISDYSTSMTADISVSESDISSVKEGQSVRLSFSAFPSLSATGTVTAVSPTGTSSGSLVNFRVTMTLPKPDKRLRPGMSVTAEIVTASAQNVLMAPNTAIDQASDGSYSVQVAQNNDTANLKTVTVTVGIANDSYTEIKSGLTAGEYVVSGNSAATSTNSSPGGGLFGGMGGGGTVRTFRNDSGGGASSNRGGSFQSGPGGGF
ncbi:MAG: efflux RND transporter periplasmic adaptor subunit [Actinomycetia bacterium]|nr:efflux RND transporter periplasmic adaptor subunit [Actinomycetes bacterium]